MVQIHTPSFTQERLVMFFDVDYMVIYSSTEDYNEHLDQDLLTHIYFCLTV